MTQRFVKNKLYVVKNKLSSRQYANVFQPGIDGHFAGSLNIGTCVMCFTDVVVYDKEQVYITILCEFGLCEIMSTQLSEIET